MPNLPTTIASLALCGALCAGIARADDIDIYFSQTGGAPEDEPLVMFSLDWRPNLNASVCGGGECDRLFSDGFLEKNPLLETITAFDLYRAVLRRVFDEISGVKVGLMINHDDGAGPSCSGPQRGGRNETKCTNGGFIAAGFRSLQENDANGAKRAFLDKLAAIPPPQGNASHKLQASEMFFELYRYLKGGDVYNGHNGYTSFDGNSGDDDLNLDDEHPEASWDAGIETSGGQRYVSPLSGSVSACGASIYTINIMFGTLNSDSDSDAAIEAARDAGGMGIDLPNNNDQRFTSVLEFLFEEDLAPNLPGKQNVTSYFLVPAANNTENGFARAGGTTAALELSDDPEELYRLLRGLFDEILSVSTTFVSASVPVNVYNRAEVLDNVYLALFQPKEISAWPGNAKKLTLDTGDLNNVFLVDANGDPAVAPDGRIKFDALTYWTEPTALPLPDPNVSGDEADLVSDGRDGRFVPRGGSGQKISGIPGSGSADPGADNDDDNARQLYTESDSGSAGALLALNADAATATELLAPLGAANAAQSLCLLKYIRGYKVTSLNSCLSPTARPWLMGDVLHSRPLALNYGGSVADPDIRILFGSNDGFLRMIRDTEGGAQSGAEVWAFMPRAVMPIVNQLVTNIAAGADHVYGVDGEISSYVVDVNKDGNIDRNAGDKVWIFFGLRRGGKAYYALDLSDPDTPRFLWSKAQSDSGFNELGLTFSQPAVHLLDWGSGAKPVLIFGGGYDPDKDMLTVGASGGSVSVSVSVGEDDDSGNALFVVDAETGDLVWKAVRSGSSYVTTFSAPGLRDSIPSAPTVLDTDDDGLADRVYVGDTGGVVWRADFPGNDSGNWSLHPVLSVGRHAGSDDRRFFHAPDVALSEDETGAFDAVVIGSGDRPHPLGTSVVNDLYVFKDRDTGIYDAGAVDAFGNPLSPPTLYSRDDLADLTDNCLQDGDLECAADTDLVRGWRLTLEGAGEKSLSTPLTLGGAVYFTTYLPPAAAAGAEQCGPGEGSGLLYTVNLQDATAVANRDVTSDDDGGGRLQKEDRVEPLSSAGIPSQVVVLTLNNLPPATVPILRPDLNVEYAPSQLNWKTFWHHKQD